ncbi:hypothetical protein QOT17_018896 [Balamuthia mandrillaris]
MTRKKHGSTTLLVLLAVIAFAAFFSYAEAQTEVSAGSFRNSIDTWSVSWTIFDDDTIEFTLESTNDGWVALGLSHNDKMPDSDVIWCYFGGAACPNGCVSDRYATIYGRPGQDASQDVTLLSASRENGRTSWHLRRQLDTGDTTGDIAITNGTSLYLLWAYGGSATPIGDDFSFSQHFIAAPSPSGIDLFQGGDSVGDLDDDDEWLRKAHIILMLLAWLVLAVGGNFVARYLKPAQGVWWFRNHVLLMGLAALLTVLGFIFIVIFVDRKEVREHFSEGSHQTLGLIILILTLIQPVIGVVADRLWFLERKKTPVVPDVLHRWLGRILLGLAMINIGLGMDLYCVSRTVINLYIAYFVVVIVALMLPHEVIRLFFVRKGGWYLGGFEVEEGGNVVMGWIKTYVKRFSLLPQSKSKGKKEGGGGHDDGEIATWLKFTLWSLQAVVAVVVVAFFIAMAVEVGDKDAAINEDPYYDSCIIGQLEGDE